MAQRSGICSRIAGESVAGKNWQRMSAEMVSRGTRESFQTTWLRRITNRLKQLGLGRKFSIYLFPSMFSRKGKTLTKHTNFSEHYNL
jgi:hypothetical protein